MEVGNNELVVVACILFEGEAGKFEEEAGKFEEEAGKFEEEAGKFEEEAGMLYSWGWTFIFLWVMFK